MCACKYFKYYKREYKFVEITTKENDFYYGEIDSKNLPCGKGVKVYKLNYFI